MKTNNNTILITGGSAGIGFEIAKQFAEKGNKVIITARDEDRLKQAAARIENVTAIRCDVSKAEDIEELVKKLNAGFPNLNMVINNAGRALVYRLSEAKAGAFTKGADEMLTNYLSVLRLNEALLPILKKQKEAAIVNVSSAVAFVPVAIVPTYAASKAALHSYTQSLRMVLSKDSGIKVFELMPPLVDTELSKEIGGATGIPPSQVAVELLAGLENDTYEIHVGNTANLYKAFLSSPAEALKLVNRE
jgi:uncharacterized oxidoreductase